MQSVSVLLITYLQVSSVFAGFNGYSLSNGPALIDADVQFQNVISDHWHRKTSSIATNLPLWSALSIPDECESDTCTLRFKQSLKRQVECFPATLCEMVLTDIETVTFHTVKPGAVLHFYPDQNDELSNEQYVYLSGASEIPLTHFHQLNFFQGEEQAFTVERDGVFLSTHVVSSVVPIVRSSCGRLYFGVLPLKQKFFNLWTLLARLIIPVNDKPELIFHLDSCQSFVESGLESGHHSIGDALPLLNFYSFWNHLTPWIHSTVQTLTDESSQREHKGVFAFRRVMDSATGSLTFKVWHQGGWQDVDDDTYSWIRGLQHIEELDRLFGIDVSGPHGFTTPHNARYWNTIDRLHRQDERDQTDKKKKNEEPDKPLIYETMWRNSKAGSRTFPASNEDQISETTSVPTALGNQRSSSDRNARGLAQAMSVTTLQHSQSNQESDNNPVSTHPVPAGFTDITDQVHFMPAGGEGAVIDEGHFFSRSQAVKGNQVALLSPLINASVHRWSMTVNDDQQIAVFGIADKDYQLQEGFCTLPGTTELDHRNPDRFTFRDPKLKAFRVYGGEVFQAGHCLSTWAEQNVRSTYTVSCEVNTEEKTFTLTVDEQPLGVIFRGFNGQHRAFVGCYGEGALRICLDQYLTGWSVNSAPCHSRPSPLVSRLCSDVGVTADSIVFSSLENKGCCFSGDLKTVFKELEQSGNSLCPLNCSIPKDRPGLYTFSFIIENDEGASTCFGVGVGEPAEYTISGIGNIYSCPHTYLFRTFQGARYAKGQELGNRINDGWRANTQYTIEINVLAQPEMHLEAQVQVQAHMRATIHEDQQQHGIAIHESDFPLRPIVAFYGGMEKCVTLIHSDFKPPIATSALASASRIAVHPYETVVCCKWPHCRKTDLIEHAGECKHAVFCETHFTTNGRRFCAADNCGKPITKYKLNGEVHDVGP